MCYLSSFIAITQIFHEESGPYLVALTLGSSLGQFIVPAFYEIFIEQYSWSGAFILMAGIALQNVPFGVIVYYSKRYKRTVGNRKSNLSVICDCTVLKDWIIWIVYMNYLLLAQTGNVFVFVIKWFYK